jgi:hypothetical protein
MVCISFALYCENTIGGGNPARQGFFVSSRYKEKGRTNAERAEPAQAGSDQMSWGCMISDA